MRLVVDVGNTNIVLAVFDGSTLAGQWRMATQASRTSDEYSVVISQFLGQGGLNAQAITDIAVASVVPQTQYALHTSLKQLFGVVPLVVTAKAIMAIGMRVDVDQPDEVGADRVINALAAFERVKGAAIVLDFGTATTFDIVSGEGAYCGGVIAPGINLSLHALQQAAARLPSIGITRPDAVIGRSTVTAMQSGIYYGYLGLIERIVAEIRQQSKINYTVLATGGLAPLFASATNTIHSLAPDLTIEGLNLFAQRTKML